MRNQLETELMNVLAPYRKGIPFEDIKAQYTIILSNYDVESRKTEIVIRDDDVLAPQLWETQLKDVTGAAGVHNDGDYPEVLDNQYDNMTGTMNL